MCSRSGARTLTARRGTEALARGVGVEGQDILAAIDDRELVDEALELGDEVRRDVHCAPAGVAILVGADDRLNELAPDDGV